MSGFEEGFIDVTGDGGILKKVLSEGSGGSPPNGYKVKAHYTGTLLNGTKFDSSRDRGDPFEFTIGKGEVIKGWDQGFATMKKGEKAILRCRSDYAYGDRATGSIPAGATLNFDVELLDFKEKKREKWELSDDEKIAEATRLKEEGKPPNQLPPVTPAALPCTHSDNLHFLCIYVCMYVCRHVAVQREAF